MSSVPPARSPDRIGHVVVVDDDPHLSLLLVAALSPYATRVRSAGDVGAACELLDPDVDVLVTDYALGDEDGLSLIRRVRATPALDHVSVVLVSGHPDGDRLARAAASLRAVFVAKPFAVRVLLAAIRRARALVPPTAVGAA